MSKKRKHVPESEYKWHISSWEGGFRFTSRKAYFDRVAQYRENAKIEYAIGRNYRGHELMQASIEIQRECSEFASWENSKNGQDWIAANWKDYDYESELAFLKQYKV